MRTFDRLLLVSALVLLGAVGFSALHDASQAWDVWYYHLPFAGRLLGIVPATEYVLSKTNEARFAGFPLGGELVQGLLWRITGRPESANLLAFASVPLFALFVRRAFGVAWHHLILALFAVPLVMTHASSAYVDLPANVCAAGLVLTLAKMRSDLRPRLSTSDGGQGRTPGSAFGLGGSTSTVLMAMAFAIGAAHMRFQLAPLVLVGLAVLFFFVRGRDRWLVVLGAPVVFAWPLKNLLVHANPAYPHGMNLGPLHLAGPESPYSSSPVWLAKWPGPIRFAASILELGARPYSDPRRWTVDQWTPPDHDGFRTGGFFGVYVVVLVFVLIACAARSQAGSRARTLAWTVALVTVIVALSPQSHELRYYLVWMLVLVVAALAATPPAWQVPLATLCAAFAIVVITVTHGDYVMPSGESFRQLVERHAADANQYPPDARVCVAKAPWTFLHAAPFHPPRRYVVVEADDDGACSF